MSSSYKTFQFVFKFCLNIFNSILLHLLMLSYHNSETTIFRNNCHQLCFSVETCIKQCENGFKSFKNLRSHTQILPKIAKYADINHRSKKYFSSLESFTERPQISAPHCGLRYVTNSTDNSRMLRIVGGEDAKPNEFPWIVSFQMMQSNGEYRHFCAGAVINEDYVITAAHCFDKIFGLKNWIIIKAGINHINSTDGQVMSIRRFIFHEEWDERNQLNDIVLIRLKQKIKYTTNNRNEYVVNSVCLNLDPQEPTGLAELAGWGQLGKHLPHSDWLQKIRLPLWDREKCAQTYISKLRITDLHVCAGGVGGEDSCIGDSGGPLTQSRHNRSYLIGIVSFGIPCAIKGLPGVYTHLFKYVDWIKENAR